MSTQHQIIAICVIVFIAVPVGTMTIIKCINKLSSPPVNVLSRQTGDIEMNYIQQGHSYPDLLQSPAPIYDRVPSYFSSGNPPSFQTVDRWYINSCLENENIINSDFIIFIFMFFMFFLVIFKKWIHYILCLYWFPFLY